MRKGIALFMLLKLSMTILAQQACPLITKELAIIDTFYHSFIVEDKYRWLEDVSTEETKEWIEDQNTYSKKALTKSKNKTGSFKKIDQYSYFNNDYPNKKGNYYFKRAYYDNFSEPALFYRTNIRGDDELLVDPNFISSKDKIRLKGYFIDAKSKYLAYGFSRNGSDWAEVKVVNLDNGIHKKDHLKGLKFSNLEWKGDGFYYCKYKQNSQFSVTKEQQIYYHKLGTSQDEDELIFERNNPYMQFRFLTTDNERFLIIKERDENKGVNNLFYIDYNDSSPHIKPLVMNYKYGLRIEGSYNGKILVSTLQENNGGVMVQIDPLNPTEWRHVLPKMEGGVLLSTKLLQDKIIAVYQKNQHSFLLVCSYQGNVLYQLEFPPASSVYSLTGDYTDKEIYFEFSTYTLPPIAYKFNIETYRKELLGLTEVSFSHQDIVYKEVEYVSEDTVKVPMVLVYKKGLKLDGNNPTILKAYGGFGVVSTPAFDAGILYFVKSGGVFAFANIRGGGDKGKYWAHEGRGDNKQSSFDDFIAGAEYLIKEKYTCAEKLAITGGSNGGLVVAAAGIQRPDLFRVVVPVVAPLDMLRFEEFTVGNFHTDEYGSVEDSVGFKNLYAYSPYNNIKATVNYPTMLVITSENDDRVPPFHSYKFVAKLQNRLTQKNPIYLKVERKAGHYGGTTLNEKVKGKAEMYGFILDALQ